MTTTAKTVSLVAIAVAGVALLTAGLVAGFQPAATEIVKLERVVIVAKRAAPAPTVVAQLPRVVIHGRSTAARGADTLVAEASTLRAKRG